MLGKFGGPADPAMAGAVAILFVGALIVLLTFEHAKWGAVAWWGAIAAFLLGLPLLALGLPVLALAVLVGAPIVLALMTWIDPGLVLRYLHWEEYGRARKPPEPRDVDAERARFATLAAVAVVVGGIALAVGGLPQRVGPVAAGGEPTGDALASRGRQLFTQFGCVACHGEAGSGTAAGPALKGILGKQERLAAGTTVTVDDAYLRESILDPNAKVVEGFQPGVMSAAIGGFSNQLQQPQTVDALIAYVRSLK